MARKALLEKQINQTHEMKSTNLRLERLTYDKISGAKHRSGAGSQRERRGTCAEDKRTIGYRKN